MRLPVLSGKEVVKLLSKIDYEVDHQTGSHIILRENKPPYRRVSIPNHKVIVPGTLLSIVRMAGLTREEFLELLK